MKKRIITFVLTVALLLTLAPLAGIRAQAASSFVVSDACVEIIKKWEGFSAKPYWDYRQWTVGYGTRVPDGKLEQYQNEGISNEEATQLLHNMLNDMGQDLNEFIDKFGLTMNQGQFDALLSLTFNCGPNWMWEPSTFRTAVVEGWKGNDFIFAIGQWSTAGGVTVPALIRRRLAEANMYLNGVYSYTPPENYAYVRFDANGGESVIITQGYDMTATDAIRAVPTYEGYKFEGWYTDPTGGEKVEVLDAGVRNYMLYAHWSAGDGVDLPQDTTEEEITGTPVNYQKQIATGVLNSFDKPVKGALVVNAYRLGEVVDICAEYTDTNGLKWGKLSSGGWINLSYTQEPQAEDLGGDGVKITVTANDVNIRRGPGTSYALTGKANKGDQMIITQTATGSGYTWGKSANGWICLKYTNYDEVANENAGNENTGNDNTGNENTGNDNTGNENTGSDNTGSGNTGNENNGNGNTGNENTDTKPQTTVMGTVVVNDGLRIRSGAGTDKPVLGYLSNNTRVEILEQTTVGGMVWGRISKGWISLDYVKLDQTAGEGTTGGNTGSNSNESTGGSTEPAPQKVTGTVVLSSDRLNVRTGPSTGYPVVSSLGNGDKVELLEQKTVGTTAWGRTAKGWICLDYVKLDASEEPTVPEAPEQGDNTGSNDTTTGGNDSNSGNDSGSNDNANTGADNGSNNDSGNDSTADSNGSSDNDTSAGGDTGSSDSVSQKVTGTVVLSSDRLNIRKGAGTSYAVVGSLGAGAKVEILEQKTVSGRAWGRIANGWICMDYVRLDAQTDNSEEKLGGTVSAGGTNLHIRTGPSTSYAIAGYLKDGSRVEILERKTVNGTQWGRIAKGWICLSYVTLDNQSASDSGTVQTKTGTVIADCLRIRSGAGTSNKIVGALYTGEKVTILETTVVDGVTWGRISKGWISLDYVKQ